MSSLCRGGTGEGDGVKPLFCYEVVSGDKQRQKTKCGILTDTEAQADSLQVIDVTAIHCGGKCAAFGRDDEEFWLIEMTTP
jgi:hypothetical protein